VVREFEMQKEIPAIAKLDPFFERTQRLASRRLKRELERRETLALESKRIPTEESDSDLFRLRYADYYYLFFEVWMIQVMQQAVQQQFQVQIARFGR
jgi:hypothetical protein